MLTTLQEDGTCMLSDQEGEPIELNLTQDIVVKALRLWKGNHVISSIKLALRDRLLAFKANNANNSFYASFKDDDTWLALQILQQYFHIHKSQRYTHLDVHITFYFLWLC